LTGLAISLFGEVEMQWREDYFPFTQPSFELEILYNGKLLEVLGCGVIHDQVGPSLEERQSLCCSR
jgi:phenylalanyl-tRNA synthetase alpha chain